MLYPIAISSGDEQHAWGVEVPDIPGCFSAGDDLDDAMGMAREAIEGHFEILAETGAAIPVANKVTLPGYLLNSIDDYALHHPEEKSRSGFLASAALKVLQQA